MVLTDYFKFLLKEYKRVLITLISVLFMGFAVSILNIIDLGTDPCTYMNMSISGHLGISFGNWQVLLNLFMFVIIFFMDKKQIGIGTIFNMLLVGYTVEFFSWIWELLGIDTMINGLFIRIIVMIPVLIIFIFAAATYMSTDLGTAPYDALPFCVASKIKKVPFKLIRFLWDCIAIIIGFLINRKIGIVTIAMALFMGQTVAFVKEKFFKNF